MWYEPEKYQKNLEDVNAQLLKLEGELDDKTAMVTFVEFLRANIGIATELISGIQLASYQEICIKGFFNRHYSMCVFGRGCGKSFIAAVFCYLYCIFEPGARILIAGPTFRTARNIFTEIEKIVNSPEAQLLAQCFTKSPSKRNDLFSWEINGGSIRAIPLNGEKIRGFRCDVLLIDEFLLLSEEIVDTVLMPFLVAPRDMKKRMKIVQKENRLIKLGKMKEEDRTQFDSTAKMIVLSSASYTFENLYKKYKEWLENIYADKDDTEHDNTASYFIAQLGYDAIPEHMIEQTVIEEAKGARGGGISNSAFLREYCAQFTDDSDGYFSAKKMKECTIPDCQDPHLQLIGEKNKRYIFSIDPSFSNAVNSDYFAIAVLELDEEKKDATLVHNYAVAGGDLKHHIKYFAYLYKSFKPEMIIIDNAGFQFIDSCNESEYFRAMGVTLSFIECWDADKVDSEYEIMLKESRNVYNKESGRICIKQVFTSEFLRRANEHLQASIDHKRIWFASRITPDDNYFNFCTELKLPEDLINVKGDSIRDKVSELISIQDKLIVEVKDQCSLIEVKSTAKGTQTFDLPSHLKKSTSATKARKDNYTALMLGAWLTKSYFDLMNQKPEVIQCGFEPIMIYDQ